jgi:hypothetical protein
MKACARIAIVLSLIVGLAGCASDFPLWQNHPPAEAVSNIAVFTGEFVDGKPLYRLPRMEVVGSRSNIGPDT